MLTRAILPDQLTASEIADHDVVVLGDAPRLNDKVADDVAAFVRQGGGLLIFSTSSVDKNWFNARWGASSKSPLLPADYLPDAKPLVKVASVSDELSAHTATAFIKQLGTDDLRSIEVKNALELKLNSTSESTENDSIETATSVLLKLDSAAPLLVAKPYGAGHVLQFATSADAVDTNLPLKPIYVPLMQSLVQWLAIGTDTNRNITTGQSISIDSPTKSDEAKQAKRESIALVTLPDRSQIEEKFDAEGQLSFNQTAFPGVYSVDFSKSVDAKLRNAEFFAASISSEESELKFLTQQQLSELATATGASVAANADELLTMQSLRSDGREVWRWFLLALVALLFVELWWQQRITRGPL